MTLSTLRTRLETATEADHAEVLEMAFDVFLPDPVNLPDCSDEYDEKWLPLVDRFAALIRASAHNDFALLIMREVLPGWNYMFGMREQDHARAYVNNGISKYVGGGMKLDPKSRWFENTAPTPALAIIAAVCAAKGDIDANSN